LEELEEGPSNRDGVSAALLKMKNEIVSGRGQRGIRKEYGSARRRSEGDRGGGGGKLFS